MMVAYWPYTTDIGLEPNVGFRGTADIARSGHQTKSVANDPTATWAGTQRRVPEAITRSLPACEFNPLQCLVLSLGEDDETAL